MKRALLLIVLPALLAALALAQTPGASSNPDQTIKGCLGGSDGNYTVTEDGTSHIFKITTTTVDFKQHLGHDVTLIGHRASAAGSAASSAAGSAESDNSLAVTELKMISDAASVLTPFGLVRQNLAMLKLVNRRSWKSRMKGIFAQRVAS